VNWHGRHAQTNNQQTSKLQRRSDMGKTVRSVHSVRPDAAARRDDPRARDEQAYGQRRTSNRKLTLEVTRTKVDMQVAVEGKVARRANAKKRNPRLDTQFMHKNAQNASTAPEELVAAKQLARRGTLGRFRGNAAAAC
jgi:hypothetical protein